MNFFLTAYADHGTVSYGGDGAGGDTASPQSGPVSKDPLLFRASPERASASGPRALASPVIHTADGAMRQALATEAAQRASDGDCQLVGMIAAGRIQVVGAAKSHISCARGTNWGGDCAGLGYFSLIKHVPNIRNKSSSENVDVKIVHDAGGAS